MTRWVMAEKVLDHADSLQHERSGWHDDSEDDLSFVSWHGSNR